MFYGVQHCTSGDYRQVTVSGLVHRKPVSRFPSNWMCQKGLSQERGSRCLFSVKALWWTSFGEHTHLHNPHSCCDRECVHTTPRNLPWVPAQSWLLSPWRQILLSSTPELHMNGLMQGFTLLSVFLSFYPCNLRVSVACSFLFLNSIPWYEYLTSYSCSYW